MMGIYREAERWEAALTGDPPPVIDKQESVIRVTGEPSAEYLDSIVAELDSLGVTIEFQTGGQTRLAGNVKDVPETLLRSIKEHKPYLLVHWCKVKGCNDRPPVPLPKRGTGRVEWVGFDDDHGTCEAGDLEAYPWVRWRYVRARRWHAFSGDTWEVSR